MAHLDFTAFSLPEGCLCERLEESAELFVLVTALLRSEANALTFHLRSLMEKKCSSIHLRMPALISPYCFAKACSKQMCSCLTQGCFIVASPKLGPTCDMLFCFTSGLAVTREAREIPSDGGQRAACLRSLPPSTQCVQMCNSTRFPLCHTRNYPLLFCSLHSWYLRDVGIKSPLVSFLFSCTSLPFWDL